MSVFVAAQFWDKRRNEYLASNYEVAAAALFFRQDCLPTIDRRVITRSKTLTYGTSRRQDRQKPELRGKRNLFDGLEKAADNLDGSTNGD